MKKENYYKNYTKTRLSFEPKRAMVWEEISKYLKNWINPNGTVVEIGSGYCDWINSIKAAKKIAIDKFINPQEHCDKDVQGIFGGFEKIKKLENNSVDVFMASNFLEHLDLKEVKQCVGIIREKLKEGGIFIIVQQNYRYSSAYYFDDYTHKSIWSHESLKNFLNANDLRVVKMMPKFLPLTMKSKLPKMRFLVWLYLRSPIKPLAGQMLLIARKPRQNK